MTMLASLKSLLFSTTPLAGATAAASAVVDGAADFAALLSDADGASQPVTSAGPATLPARVDVEADAPVVTPDQAAAPALPDTVEYLAQRTMPVQPAMEPASPVAEPTLPDTNVVQDQAAPAPVKTEPSPIVLPEGKDAAEALPEGKGAAEALPEGEGVSEALPLPTREPAIAPVDMHAPAPVSTVDAPRPLPVEAQGPTMPALTEFSVKIAPESAPQPAAMPAPAAEDAADVDSEADRMTADAPRKGDDQPVADPIFQSLPATLPPLPQAPVDAPASSAPSAPTREMPLSVSPSLSPLLSQTQAPSKPAMGQEKEMAPAVGADGQDDQSGAKPAALSSVAPVMAAAMLPAQAVPVAAKATEDAQPAVQTVPQPTMAAAPVTDVDMPAQMTVAAAQPMEKEAPRDPQEGDVDIATVPTDAPAAPVAARPARAEALSLLQLVRDHMNRRATPVRDSAEAAPSASDRPIDKASAAVDPAAAYAPATAHRGAEPVMSQGTVPQAPSALPATMPPAMPAVDLSASLGQQMVDMGVSGQWIDGLARDIAGLSANGAQGRFQINADQLGPIQVDIRQDGNGAAVRLTVASEAAEMALRQDSDRLKLDAGLSAVRINEVKIERAPHGAEAARGDTNGQSGNQSNGQQGGASHQQAAWQGSGQMAGQSMGQSSSQGRWQSRENNDPGHKSGGDPVVLNHGDAGDSAGDVRRARYA